MGHFTFFFFFFFFFFSIAIVFFASQSQSSPTDRIPDAYDIIRDYDFPIGILPKGVQSYDLDTSTGRFAAYFNGTCSFSLEGSYQLKYRSTIKGHITKGKLSSLEGVSVKLFLFWVDIVEVKRSGDDLEFSVGITGAGFPVDNFEECPQCGCGLNCDGVGVGGSQGRKELKGGSLVSSS